MNIDVVELASELIAMPSETPTSNRPISDFLRGVLEEGGFAVEEVTYIDPSDEEKVSLVAKRGAGAGGVGLVRHSGPGRGGWACSATRTRCRATSAGSRSRRRWKMDAWWDAALPT